MKDGILLSVCIPTYNRCNVVVKLCKELLKIVNTNFSVLVIDNDSTDNTFDMLNKINDSRLIVLKNASCIGGAANTLKSIFSTKSKYTLVCNDRDKIDILKLEKLIYYLENKDYSIILTSQKKSHLKNKSFVIKNGIKALLKLNYCYHPTGIVYNTIVMKNHLSYNDIILLKEFPYCYAILLRSLCMYADVLVYDFGLWIEADPEYKKVNVSNYLGKGELWFDPDSRFRQYLKFLSNDLINIDSFNCCKYYKCFLVLKGYRYFSRLATLGYMVILNNEAECLHYQVKIKSIKFNDIMKIFRNFNNKVFSNDKVLNNCNIVILRLFQGVISLEIIIKYVVYKFMRLLL